jgi:hypothetical protein
LHFDMLEKMLFQSEVYGPDVARILALEGAGQRLMPLVKGGSVSSEARAALTEAGVARLFPEAKSPDAALAGLYLYFGCWDEGHTAADSVESPDGYFWHAIAHRQEPDAENAKYWFGKTGTHPVFARLGMEAVNAGYDARREWDPFAFVDFCETAKRRGPGSREEKVAMRVQLVEWQLLFDYCAKGRTR